MQLYDFKKKIIFTKITNKLLKWRHMGKLEMGWAERLAEPRHTGEITIAGSSTII